MKKKKNYKNCLHRGPYTQCEKIAHKENLDQSQNHLRAPVI